MTNDVKFETQFCLIQQKSCVVCLNTTTFTSDPSLWYCADNRGEGSL